MDFALAMCLREVLAVGAFVWWFALEAVETDTFDEVSCEMGDLDLK